MKNIIFIFGTRPEIIKLAPVILELKKYPEDYNVIICNTEQQKELSNQTLAYFGLKADINLDCMRENQSLSSVQARILTSLDKVFCEREIELLPAFIIKFLFTMWKPDFVLMTFMSRFRKKLCVR